MFQVKAPVVIVASSEARAALGAQLRPTALAAWLEIARRGKGIELAYFQIVHTGVTLAVASRLRADGYIEIDLGMGDPRQAARVIMAEQLRQAEARTASRRTIPARRA